ncbi:MAG: hypothetical protein HQ541_18315 [Mariniphaga sp.]|nr:hypothetical protein [Mariniphaga sp.]
MKAKSFIEIWKEFHKEELKDLIGTFSYDNKVGKTEAILGKKKDVNSKLGYFIENYFAKHHVEQTRLKYFKEDFTRDLTVVQKGKKYKVKTKSYHNEPIKSTIKNYYYSYELILEHENDILLCQQEMIKLTYFKAPLKVLVTYCWDNEKDDENKIYRDRAKCNFQTIIEKSNQYFPENNSTEYLLIIGQKNQTDFNWYYYIFKFNWTEKIVEEGTII